MAVREDSRHVRRKVSEDDDDGSEVFLDSLRVFAFQIFSGSLSFVVEIQ